MSLNLILNIPHGAVTATSLGMEGFARHRSPGSGKHFRSRAVFVDLKMENDRPAFRFLDEGGWRDANADALEALEGARSGKRTKTALSNNAFSCTPIDAYDSCCLVKTGGEALTMQPPKELVKFASHECDEGMTPDMVAKAVGLPSPVQRKPRLYMVVCPVELIILSNLTPEEYAWYATHRPGKIFRQVMFTELKAAQPHLAAESRFEDARREMLEGPTKKTKTVVSEDCMNRVPFRDWIGYSRQEVGGLYSADRNKVNLWQFPDIIPFFWERAEG